MNSTNLRLGFAGTPDLAAHILQAIIETKIYEIAFVYTQPDRPAGRGHQQTKSPVKQLAELYSLGLKQPESGKDIDPGNELANIDFLIVAAYGMILPADILDKPKFGCINVHTSLLPRWRGAAPIQRAIQSGDSETGITIMQMDDGLDTGDILLQRACPIHESDTAGVLHDRLAGIGAQCLLDTLADLANERIIPRKQQKQGVCYAHKIKKTDALIDWTLPAIAIERAIRAFNPVPVAYTTFTDIKTRIWHAQVMNSRSEQYTPGSVIAYSAEGIDVATGDQILRILNLQLPGKKMLSVYDFYNGNPDIFSKQQ